MKKKAPPLISVIIPVRNGEAFVRKCLASLKALNYPAKKVEIILADGRSTDKTRLIARRYGVKIIDNPRLAVVSGRNVGFSAAKGEFLAFTDIDCTFRKDWLKNSLKYFRDPLVGGVSGPNLIPPSESPFSKAVGLIFDIAYFFNAGSPTRKYKKVIESRSHGSNIIFRRQVLKKVFPVDETLVEGEDVLMTEKIEKLGYKLLYVPDVVVNHFRRATPARWLNQMARYAQAKVLLQRRQVKKVTFTHKLVGFFIPLLFGFLILGLIFPAFGLMIAILAIITLFLLFSYAFFESKSSVVSLNFVYATVIMLFAWSFGYLKELIIASNRKWDYQ